MKFADVVINLISLINLVLWVLSSLALVVFFWGLVKYVYNTEDAHAHEEGRETIMWSLIALFVLFSIWGILQLLNISFFDGTSFGGSSDAPINLNSRYQGTGTGPGESNYEGTLPPIY